MTKRNHITFFAFWCLRFIGVNLKSNLILPVRRVYKIIIKHYFRASNRTYFQNKIKIFSVFCFRELSTAVEKSSRRSIRIDVVSGVSRFTETDRNGPKRTGMKKKRTGTDRNGPTKIPKRTSRSTETVLNKGRVGQGRVGLGRAGQGTTWQG